MVTWVLRCKLYPGATPWRDIRPARPSRGGGLIPRATVGLDRWLSRQNPAYRPASQKAPLKWRSSENRRFSVDSDWESPVFCPPYGKRQQDGNIRLTKLTNKLMFVDFQTRSFFAVGEAFMPPAYTVRFRLTVRKKRDVSPPGGMNASPTVLFATFPKQPDKHQFVVLLS